TALAAGAVLLLAAAARLGAVQSDDTLRVEVDLVSIVATVTDAEGRYVTGLGPEDFILEDNGVPQEIVHFTQDRDIPVSLGIALDASASMVDRMRVALTALDRFVRTLHEEDDVFIATFANDVSLLSAPTRDRDALTAALDRIRPAGGTALYDAAVSAIERVRQGRHDKRAILLLTDGSDTASALDLG